MELYTQVEFSRLTGITRPTLNKWEKSGTLKRHTVRLGDKKKYYTQSQLVYVLSALRKTKKHMLGNTELSEKSVINVYNTYVDGGETGKAGKLPIFCEKNITLEAIGVLTMVLGLSGDYEELTMDLILSSSNDDKESFELAFDDLSRYGYLIRKRLYDRYGKPDGIEYNFYDVPQGRKPGDPTIKSIEC